MSLTERCDSKSVNQIRMDIDGGRDVTHVDHSSDFTLMYMVCLFSSLNLTTYRVASVAVAALCTVGLNSLNFGIRESNPIRCIDVCQLFSVSYVLCRSEPCNRPIKDFRFLSNV